MKVCLLTLGCKVNQAEVSEIAMSLRGCGHEIVGISDAPDVCVVNTCTVTSKSDYQSRQLIRRAGRTGARVIATGCYSELNKESVRRMEEVQTVIGNADKDKIISMIDETIESNVLEIIRDRSRYFLKVQDGCNSSCSYCIVPRARGRSRSVSPRRVIDNVKRAVDGGYREVVLTGIHLGQYGTDLDGVSLSGLVEGILNNTNIERLRLSSLEVNEVDEGLLDLFDSPRLAPHLHIPLQSGDDGVLRLMGRAYNSSSFRKTVSCIRDRLGDIALGSDVIAGFPLETEVAFENTLRLVEELPISYLHVFPYSRRPGTPAAEMEDKVGESRRKARASALRALSEKKREAYLKRQAGRTLEVLIEERIADSLYRGTSGNYLKVQVSGRGLKQGIIVPVSISGTSRGELSGVPVNSL